MFILLYLSSAHLWHHAEYRVQMYSYDTFCSRYPHGEKRDNVLCNNSTFDVEKMTHLLLGLSNTFTIDLHL